MPPAVGAPSTGPAGSWRQPLSSSRGRGQGPGDSPCCGNPAPSRAAGARCRARACGALRGPAGNARPKAAAERWLSGLRRGPDSLGQGTWNRPSWPRALLSTRASQDEGPQQHRAQALRTRSLNSRPGTHTPKPISITFGQDVAFLPQQAGMAILLFVPPIELDHSVARPACWLLPKLALTATFPISTTSQEAGIAGVSCYAQPGVLGLFKV